MDLKFFRGMRVIRYFLIDKYMKVSIFHSKKKLNSDVGVKIEKHSRNGCCRADRF